MGDNFQQRVIMPKHIVIVSCSAESAALCYSTLCSDAHAVMGEHMHPEVSMHTYPLGEYIARIRSGGWNEAAKLMIASAEKLTSIGAELLISPDNTIHEVFEQVAEASSAPWIPIADVVGAEAVFQGYTKLGIVGTKHLIKSPVYPEKLGTLGISYEIPDEKDHERMTTIVLRQLVNGIYTNESRLFFNEVIGTLKDKGCDAVILGCGELSLLVNPDDCPLPVLDSTRLLARAALKMALEDE